MVSGPTTKPIAWSYSALTRYLTCGKQYHHLNVLKDFEDTPSEKSIWGERLHKYMAEMVVRRSEPELAHRSEFAYLAPVIDRFRAIAGECRVERQVAINNKFKETEWWAEDAWCRGIFDAVWVNGDTAKIVDWKAGRRKVDSRQLKLFALLAFCIYPEVNRVNTAFVWLQSGQIDIEKFKREDFTYLWQDLLPDVRRLEIAHKTQTWIPKPSGLCKGWCPVKSCSFWDGAKMEPIATETA